MNLKNSMNHYEEQGEKSAHDLIKYESIPLSKIDFNPDNVFALVVDTEREITEFAKTLKETDGALHNIVVERKGDRYVLISGERRVRAYRLLGKETILAQIRPESASWLDRFKLICSANNEICKYTNEESDDIVCAIGVILEENCPNEYNRKLLLSMVQNAFGISQSQAYKYVNVYEKLNYSLKELYYAEFFSIDEAALYSGLTPEAQYKIKEIYLEYVNAKEIAQTYAKKVKTILVNYKKGLRKLKSQRDYASDRLEDAKSEGKEEDIRKYEESLAAIEKLMQEFLDKRDEDIKNVEVTEPTVQPKKSSAEELYDVVNEISIFLDSYVKLNGSNENVEQIRELLATLLA